MYTSQYGQDKWLIEHIFPGKTHGYFLEMGAVDGIHYSNTFSLERLGWSGLCVEPHPQAFSELVANRGCLCVNYAVAAKSGKVPFAAPQDGMRVLSGIPSYYTDSYKQFFNGIDKAPIIEVEAITIAELLDKYKAPRIIDYFSLDTEGTELEILETFPFDKHMFLTLTVEHNAQFNGDEHRQKMFDLLSKRGYQRVVEHEVDDFYVLS